MNSNKMIFTVVFLIAVFTLNAESPPVTRQSNDSETDFIIETVGEGTVARVTGYNGTKTEIRIPGQIKRMTIVAIGERAFYKRGLTSVAIPRNVIYIGSGAFVGNELTQITIGANVKLYEDSFDPGFANFYLESGLRAGTYIFNDKIWTIQTIADVPDYTVTPVEPPKTKKGIDKFDMDFYGGFSVGMGFWDYGPSSFIPSLSLHLGTLIKTSSLTIGLFGDFGGFLGIAFPVFEDIGITYGYYFGSSLEFFFSDIFGFSLGGGAAKGYFNTRNDLGNKYFYPFAELNIMLGNPEYSFGPFFRYYFNDAEKFYNKFSVGIKMRGWY